MNIPQPPSDRPDPHVSIAVGITEISQAQRDQIKKMVVNSQPSAYPTLEQQLRDQFGELNRDWRRIAVTETAIKANEAYLSRSQPGDQVCWLARPGACKYCQQLNGRIFRVVLPSQKHKNPQEEVWVGKVIDNHGKRLNPFIRLPSGKLRKRRPEEKKAPAAPLHENCRCTWTPYLPKGNAILLRNDKESAVGSRPGSVDAQGRISPDVGISPAFLASRKTSVAPPMGHCRPYSWEGQTMNENGLSLRYFITPKLVGFWWWVNVISSIFIFLVGLISSVGLRIQNFPEAVMPVVSPLQLIGIGLFLAFWLLVTRIALEFLAIIFSIHDRLLNMTNLMKSAQLPSSSPASSVRKAYTPIFGSRNDPQ